MGLVGGVLALNAVFVAVGYCVLAAPLAGRGLRERASWCGVALLVGAWLGAAATFVAVIAGATARPRTFLAVACLLGAAGLLAASSRRLRALLAAPQAPAAPPARDWQRLAGLTAAFALVAVAVLALVGGFRSSPWLDDVWGIWLPKGVALADHGLDPRMFAADPRYVAFEVPDYPLWWSIVLALDVRFAGTIDLRAVDAQLALLVVAFVGAVVRLLWGSVRPWLLLCALLPLALAPELHRHSQGGLADLALGLQLALFALVLGLWIVRRQAFYLLLAFAAGAAAVATKSEGLPELLLLAVLAVGAALLVDARAVWGIAVATAAAAATAIPWALWRAAHDVPASVSVRDALDPGYLAGRAERAGPAAGELAQQLLHPYWLFAVPVALVGAAVLAARLRRPVLLAPAVAVLALYAFWVWAYWAETEDLDYLLSTSAYRVVDAAALIAALSLPPLAEVAARRWGD